jgi:hypothetical protein
MLPRQPSHAAIRAPTILPFVLGDQQRVVGVRDQPGDRAHVIGRNGG